VTQQEFIAIVDRGTEDLIKHSAPSEAVECLQYMNIIELLLDHVSPNGAGPSVERLVREYTGL